MSAAPESSVVELFLGPDALLVDVFDRYTADVSMLEVGTAFTFSFWYSDLSREAPWRVLVDRERGLKCGHLVTLAIDGDAVLSGIVETRAVGDAKGRDEGPSFTVSGRDLLGGAVSFDADPTLTLPGRQLEDALGVLYSGVGVVPEVSESIPPTARAGSIRRPRRGAFGRKAKRGDLTRVKHPRVGEKVQQVVERIVRGLGFRVWTTPAEGSGRTAVVVDRPRTTGPVLFRLARIIEDGRVTADSNIEGGRETTSIANVPTTVTVYANAPRGDAASAKIARTVENGFLLTPAATARVSDDAPPRPRYVESKQARTVEAAHNEAARICAQANEGFRRAEYTVLGHRKGGKLWLPNNRVAVRDDLLGIDETMLIVSVTYEGSKQGSQVTRLTLLPEGALSEFPEVEDS